jgi:hypothetical protein
MEMEASPDKVELIACSLVSITTNVTTFEGEEMYDTQNMRSRVYCYARSSSAFCIKPGLRTDEIANNTRTKYKSSKESAMY